MTKTVTILRFFFSFFQCGRNEHVLQQAFTLLERAKSVSSKNADLYNEVSSTVYLELKQNVTKENVLLNFCPLKLFEVLRMNL